MPARRSPRRSASSTSSTSPPRRSALMRRSSWSTSRRARSPKGRTRESRMPLSPSRTTISLESPPARRIRRLHSFEGRLKSRGASVRRRSSPLTSSPSLLSCRRVPHDVLPAIETPLLLFFNLSCDSSGAAYMI
ncbi:hypothetical protein ZEAMMB73_Zm00001d044939 [Zea mays]|uniref:Uncharacterized protein n=1 Tax=Zea mays TaxID=4577 RepID=K7V9E1_MAIZE|nr:hypothetical protein ZEAMMB73_Zm00001d044939 [Zea mays]